MRRRVSGFSPRRTHTLSFSPAAFTFPSTRATHFNTRDATTSVSTRPPSPAPRQGRGHTRRARPSWGCTRGFIMHADPCIPEHRGRRSAGPRNAAPAVPARQRPPARGSQVPKDQRTGLVPRPGHTLPSPTRPRVGDPQCACPPGPCSLTRHTHSVCYPRHKCSLGQALPASLLGPLLTQTLGHSTRTSHRVRLPLRGLCICLALDYKASFVSDSKNRSRHFLPLLDASC